jgi:hypothetical protein
LVLRLWLGRTNVNHSLPFDDLHINQIDRAGFCDHRPAFLARGAGILAKLETAAGTAAKPSEPAYLNRPISANTAAAAPTKNAQTAQRARHRSGRIAQICHKWGISCVPILAIPEPA